MAPWRVVWRLVGSSELGLFFGLTPFLVGYDWSDYYTGSDYLNIVNDSGYLIIVGTQDGRYVGKLKPGETAQLPYASDIVYARQNGEPFTIHAAPDETIDITTDMVE